MKALTWEGVNEPAVTSVPDPQILNRQDAILKVNLSSVCGSDLHQLSGYISFMRAGDVIGHEFMGEIIEVGPDVRRRRVGERVLATPTPWAASRAVTPSTSGCPVPTTSPSRSLTGSTT